MMRAVIFVNNDTAKEIGSCYEYYFEDPVVAHTAIYGLSPLSPKDIRECWDDFNISDDTAIVELMCEPGKFGLINSLKREDVISVNLHKGNGLFYPYRMFKPYCMFSKDTNIFTDEIGWKHPMPGISWIRNRQCMNSDAYTQMMENLSNRQGSIVVAYIENIFRNSLLTQDIIDEYKL